MSELQFFPPANDAVKGFALTPTPIVDQMVAKLFASRHPTGVDTLLDPGCGTGEFIDGVVRWCEANGCRPPRTLGIELHSKRAAIAAQRFSQYPHVEIRTADFLRPMHERFDYIIGNPPYVSLTGLSAAERLRYRRDFETATGRFDLYTLFMEQALSLLQAEGRLVFITPEKFLYVDSAASTRGLLTAFNVQELHFVPEDSFDGLVTYPLVSTIQRGTTQEAIVVRLRDGTVRNVRPPETGDSWLPSLMGANASQESLTLADVSRRISCGVATGADSVFILRSDEVPANLARFAHDTVSGRQLSYGAVPRPTQQMLVPYHASGELMSNADLGPLRAFLEQGDRRRRLEKRVCSASKPWYAFHETPPMRDMRRVKILCKDIGERPHFAVDLSRRIIPRHSIYYIVPKDESQAVDLCAYLNSSQARRWLLQNCQRAAKGFVRLQSSVLKRLPLPAEFAARDDVARHEPSVRRSA